MSNSADELKPVPNLDYTIVIPSRKRTFNMPLIRHMLPSATVCVDEREEKEYRYHVPKDKLLLHPPMDGAPLVFNWIRENIQSEILIQVADDFVGVVSNYGRPRRIRNPDFILTLLENAALACKDLELSAFCFSRTANRTFIQPTMKPFSPTQVVFGAWGIMGPARDRKYEEQFIGREDVDWTLRTLLHERCVLCDMRYYFDTQKVFGNRGGNFGILTREKLDRSTENLKKRWGKYMDTKPLPFQKNRKVHPLRVKVNRSNPLAQK